MNKVSSTSPQFAVVTGASSGIGYELAQSAKDDTAEVDRQGFEALMKGRHAIVVGSLKNRIEANIARVMPQKFAAKMQETMTRPNSPSDR